MSPFAYPAHQHVRRHGPQGYQDPASFRPWLRDEFSFRCVCCLRREAWYQAVSLEIDHFQPLSQVPTSAAGLRQPSLRLQPLQLRGQSTQQILSLRSCRWAKPARNLSRKRSLRRCCRPGTACEQQGGGKGLGLDAADEPLTHLLPQDVRQFDLHERRGM